MSSVRTQDFVGLRRLLAITTMVAAAAALMWGLYLARQVLLLVYVSALLAIGFSPLVRALERWPWLGRSRRVGILVVYVAIVGTLAALSWLIVPPLLEQLQALTQSLPELLTRGQATLRAHHLIAREITFGDLAERLPAGNDLALGVAAAALGVVGGVFGVVTILVLTYYMLVESDALVHGLVWLFPATQRPLVRRAARGITDKVSTWLLMQLVLGGVIGVTTAVGLSLIGVPYVFPLALLAAVGELIPYVGPFLAAAPALGLALSVSVETAAVTAVFFVLQQQLENHVLVPLLLGNRLGLGAVPVIVALLVGGSMLGLIGVLVAIPTLAIVHVVGRVILAEGTLDASA